MRHSPLSHFLSIAIAVAAVPVLGPGAGAAGAPPAACVADCNEDGSVLVNELVSAVSIALGVVALSTCPGADASGDGQVMIAELVDAVSDALYGCGVTPPTPPPTRTSTPTPTVTTPPAPTVTPTSGGDVSGRWQADQIEVASSTCPELVTQSVRDDVDAGSFNCLFDVDQQGSSASVIETCPGDEILSYTADVDPQGVVTLVDMDEDQQDGCRFGITTTVSADLSRSPSSGSATFDYAFQASCGIADCRVVIDGRFTRIAQP